MIEIKSLESNVRSYSSLQRIERRTRDAIRSAFYNFGKDLKQESRRLIKEPPKTGRIYVLRIGGKRIVHQASAPGEAPANLTGKLRASVNYNVSRANEIRFGAGSEGDVEYAKTLELGDSRIKKRPYLLPSINKNEKLAYEHLRTALKKGLCK
jgi:hypothetical protein